MKEQLLKTGSGFLTTLRDSWNREDIPTHCFNVTTSKIILELFDGKSFEDLSEDEALSIIRDFIYPIAYGDITITEPFASAIKTDCIVIIKNMPQNLLNQLHNM